MKRTALTLAALLIGAGSLTACSDSDDELSAGPSMRTPVAILPAPARLRPVKRVPVAIIPAPSWWH